MQHGKTLKNHLQCLIARLATGIVVHPLREGLPIDRWLMLDLNDKALLAGSERRIRKQSERLCKHWVQNGKQQFSDVTMYAARGWAMGNEWAKALVTESKSTARHIRYLSCPEL